jgi:hypothetical protein
MPVQFVVEIASVVVAVVCGLYGAVNLLRMQPRPLFLERILGSR